MSTDRAKAYTEAGVDIQAGNDLVARIKHLVYITYIILTLQLSCQM